MASLPLVSQGRELLIAQILKVARFPPGGLSELLPVFSADLSTIDGRKEAAATLKALVEGIADKQVRSRLEIGAPPRQKGFEPAGDLDSQIAEAEKKGDYILAGRLKGRKLDGMRYGAGMAAPTK